MKLLIVRDEDILEFVIVVPDGQTHEQVRERVDFHLDEAQQSDDWTYSGISLALANEGYTIIGGNALDEVNYSS